MVLNPYKRTSDDKGSASTYEKEPASISTYEKDPNSASTYEKESTSVTIDVNLDYQHNSACLNSSSNAATSRSKSSGLAWRNLRYQVPTATKGIRRLGINWRSLLDDLSGEVCPGEMVAIMGSSGAGKSTLLNALSGRLKTGRLEGTITFNGTQRVPRLFKKQAAYVEQDDLMYPQLSVRETIQYAATLKLPSKNYSIEAKRARVEEVIKALRLDRCADTVIGDSYTRGVSGGERKRTSIGVELVTEPEFMFLDEATSGLDSNSALHVCQVVRDLCRDRDIGVLMTIHQPSAKTFNLFDKIILLCRGQVVYSGPRADTLDYFASLGYHCGQHENPADFFMDLVTFDESTPEAMLLSKARIERLTENFRAQMLTATPAGTVSLETVATADFTLPPPPRYGKTAGSALTIYPPLPINNSSLSIRHGPSDVAPWALSWPAEFLVLLERCWKAQVRAKFAIAAFVVRTLIIIILIGFTYFQIDTAQSSIQNRIGILFFIPIDLMLGAVMPRLLSFSLQADILLRERSSGSYRVSSFYLAKFLTELPFVVVLDALYLTAVYFMTHLQYDASKYFTFMGVTLLVVVTSVVLGMAVGAVFRRLQLSQIIAPLIIIFLLLFGGNLVNTDTVTPALSWIRFISPVFYSYHALTRNEFTGLVFSCGDNKQCLATGAQVISYYNLEAFEIDQCVGLICVMMVVYNIIAYTALRINFKPRHLWI
ncbi:hypothetical protein IWQ60_004328 [Tieghemiomyces parasiticus]|uniref:ABC transporter domain-containing protein n=1 Tax=Tieghemiomyces parasiticus TaxID=78921 RepID=A0A9W8AB61_9FUNG|nr:hypothetical protein IWQ60_004328 [Tieghemiomyces parasiticus]